MSPEVNPAIIRSPSILSVNQVIQSGNPYHSSWPVAYWSVLSLLPLHNDRFHAVVIYIYCQESWVTSLTKCDITAADNQGYLDLGSTKLLTNPTRTFSSKTTHGMPYTTIGAQRYPGSFRSLVIILCCKPRYVCETLRLYGNEVLCCSK